MWSYIVCSFGRIWIRIFGPRSHRSQCIKGMELQGAMVRFLNSLLKRGGTAKLAYKLKLQNQKSHPAKPPSSPLRKVKINKQKELITIFIVKLQEQSITLSSYQRRIWECSVYNTFTILLATAFEEPKAFHSLHRCYKQ